MHNVVTDFFRSLGEALTFAAGFTLGGAAVFFSWVWTDEMWPGLLLAAVTMVAAGIVRLYGVAAGLLLGMAACAFVTGSVEQMGVE